MDDFKYEKLVRQITKRIESGGFRPGEKLPSVRRVAREQGYGIITVLRAYAVLEERGLIAAQARSGFIVTPRLESKALPASPLSRPATGKPVKVSLANEIVSLNRDPKLIPFGGASLSLDLLPVEELKKIELRQGRRGFERYVRYESVMGALELRQAISRHSLTQGGGVLPENLIVTAGGTQALETALRLFLRPGDRVAVESPCYFGILWMLERMGLRVLEIPATAGEGMSIPALEAVCRRGEVKAVIVHPNFQNPLGSLMPDTSKARIAWLAAKYKIPAIEADTVSDLFTGQVRPKPIQAFDNSGWVLSYGSFSKLIAPGFRCGYLAPGRFLSETVETTRVFALATPAAHQLTLAGFIRGGGYDQHLRRLRKYFQTQLPRFIAKLVSSFPENARVSRPSGGYLLWVELPKAVSGRAVWEKARGMGISVTPGELFSSTGYYRNYLRINCGMAWTPRVEAAIETLGKLARD
jgi:DNA-binding transcriptional MocR family regulator